MRVDQDSTHRYGTPGWRRAPLVGALVALAAVALTLGAQVDSQHELDRSRGQAFFEEKRYGEAADAFERVVSDPGATAADWLNLALARYEQSEDAAVIAALEQAERLDGELTGVHYLRGLVAKRNDRAEEALAALRTAAALDDADAAILYNLAWAYEATGRPEEATPLYDRIIAMGFDIGLQHYTSSLYRRGFLDVRAGNREAGQASLLASREAQQRLSQAQRAPAALEQGRHKRIMVTPETAVGPSSTATELVTFAPHDEPFAVAPLVDRIDGRPVAVVAASAGALRFADGTVLPLSLPVGPAALGDADRDGRIDLAVIDGGVIRLFRNDSAAEIAPLVEWTVAGLPTVEQPSSIGWVDVDHDGDLDLVVTQDVVPGVRLIDNLGGGTFAETTDAAGLVQEPAASGFVWADFDDDNDTDLYLFRSAAPNSLLTNLRAGRFEDIGVAVGAGGGSRAAAAAVAEDLDNDGDFDLGLLTASGLRLLANDGDGTFDDRGLLELPAGERLLAGDVDNDGWVDLVVSSAGRTDWWPNAGGFDFGAPRPIANGLAERLFDWNRDGALDVLLADSGAWQWHTQAGPARGWLAVSLGGIKNNVRGRGAKIEVKSEGLYQIRTLRDASAHFGLGEAAAAAVVRITWPNGIVQNELEVPASTDLGSITEVERLEGSCPLLYTWDGERWRFINEVLGVAPLGMPLGAEAIHPADFDEYVPVAGEALQPRDGFLELRFTEELREAGYLDAIRLIAVDRPIGMRVLPDEKFVAPPHPEFRLFAVTDPRPLRAQDQDGVDWTEALAEVDGNWTRPFERDRYEGLATPHWLELEIDDAEPGQFVRLFLTGWVYWATGSINVVVDEDPRTSFDPVALQVHDGSGWRTAIEDIGLPNAKNSTLAVDLTELVGQGHRRFRLATTMRLYWDAAFYTVDDLHPEGLRPVGDWSGAWNVPRPGVLELDGAPGVPQPRLTVLAPQEASIDYRGFSQLNQGADGFETFDYQTVVDTAPWNQHRGSYTRYGPVTELLQEADDRFVIVGTGDEVTVRFQDRLPPLGEGWRRDWLVYLNGWVKDGDPNTLGGDRVEPLPFHAMSRYPYGGNEAFPDTPAHRSWRATYNQRPARLIHPPLRPGARGSVGSVGERSTEPDQPRRSQTSKQ